MTTSDLRDRLDELAAAVPTPDTSRVDRAWRAAGRRRRRASVAGATVGVAAVAVGSVVVLGNHGAGPRPAPAPALAPTESPDRALTPSSPPDGEYDGVPVWWAPDAGADRLLAPYGASVPAEVDLSAGRPDLGPADALLAVHAIYAAETGRFERFVALARNGTTYALPALQVRPNRDQDGNAAALLPFAGGLSPDGRYLAVAQRSAIEVYDVREATWRTIDTPDWVAESSRWLDDDTLVVPSGEPDTLDWLRYSMPGDDLAEPSPPDIPNLGISDDQPYGAWTRGPRGAEAGSYFLTGPVSGGDYSNPDGIIVRRGDDVAVLALSVEGRGKGCCPVVGWLDDDLIAFETNGRVLAWWVGSSTLVRVSEQTGRTSDEAVATSWADDLLGDAG